MTTPTKDQNKQDEKQDEKQEQKKVDLSLLNATIGKAVFDYQVKTLDSKAIAYKPVFETIASFLNGGIDSGVNYRNAKLLNGKLDKLPSDKELVLETKDMKWSVKISYLLARISSTMAIEDIRNKDEALKNGNFVEVDKRNKPDNNNRGRKGKTLTELEIEF